MIVEIIFDRGHKVRVQFGMIQSLQKLSLIENTKSGSSRYYTMIVEIIFDRGHKVRVQFGMIQSL